MIVEVRINKILSAVMYCTVLHLFEQIKKLKGSEGINVLYLLSHLITKNPSWASLWARRSTLYGNIKKKKEREIKRQRDRDRQRERERMREREREREIERKRQREKEREKERERERERERENERERESEREKDGERGVNLRNVEERWLYIVTCERTALSKCY